MFLVVDANVVFSALISRSKTFELFKLNHFLKVFQLVAPEFLLSELREHEDEILKKSGLTKQEFEKIIKLIFDEIKIVPVNDFKKFLTKAKKISPPEDFPYVALALKLKDISIAAMIWSNDKKLKEMLRKNKIIVLSTTDLMRILIGAGYKI